MRLLYMLAEVSYNVRKGKYDYGTIDDLQG